MEKDLNYWKKNAEEDYMKVPISVLRYITELEKVVLPQADVIKSVCVHCGKGRDLHTVHSAMCLDRMHNFE
jgi:hypothetical protein